MAYAGSTSTNRSSDHNAGILRLLAYLAAALLLMVVDHRGAWLKEARRQASAVVAPLYWVASAPVRVLDGARGQFASHQQLALENAQLREALLLGNARMHRLEAVARENERLRELLGGTRGYRLDVQLTGVIDIDLDPFRHRVVLDQGRRSGVVAGQALIDAGGLAGQVSEVRPNHAVALLVTDPDHAVPVQVVRSGLRLLAYGTGERDRLSLRNIPLSGDVRPGDELVTSGIGGGFPAGFPVGRIVELRPDATRLFLEADARPATRVERSGELLLVGMHAAAAADAAGVGPESPGAVDPGAVPEPDPEPGTDEGAGTEDAP
ncbi:MAG: rod shape-determining protein MreC [Lysobacteraceae bacterium]